MLKLERNLSQQARENGKEAYNKELGRRVGWAHCCGSHRAPGHGGANLIPAGGLMLVPAQPGPIGGLVQTRSHPIKTLELR